MQMSLECEAMDAARERLTSQLEESAQQLQRVEVEVKRSKLDLEAASEELRTLRAETAKKRNQAAALRQEWDHHSQEVTSLSSKLQSASQEAGGLRESLRDVLLEVSNHTVALARAQEERNQLRRRINEVNLSSSPSQENSCKQVSLVTPLAATRNVRGDTPKVAALQVPTVLPPPGSPRGLDLHNVAPSPASFDAGAFTPGGMLSPRMHVDALLPSSRPGAPPPRVSRSLCGTPGHATPNRNAAITQPSPPADSIPSPGRIEQARHRLEAAQARHGEISRESLSAVSELALMLEEMGSGMPEAGKLLRRALSGNEVLLGAEHLDTLRAANNLAVFLDNAGEKDEALSLYRRASAGRRRQLGSQHPYTLDSLYNLASFLWQAGQASEAEEIFREVRDNCLRVFGPRHHGTLDCMERLGEVLEARGALEEAQAVCEELLRSREEVHGPHHPDVLRTSVMLTSMLTSSERTAKAEEAHRDAVQRHTQALGLDDPVTLELTYNLVVFLENCGKEKDAEQVLRSALSACEQVFGASSPVVLTYVDNLAIFLERFGDRREAEAFFRRALQCRCLSLGWEHEDTLRSANNLAVLLDALHQDSEALQLYRQVLAGRARLLGEDHRKTLESKYTLAVHLADHGGAEEAISHLNAVVAKLESQGGQEGQWVLACVRRLGELHSDRNEYRLAEAMFRRVLVSYGNQNSSEAADAANTLALVLARQGRHGEAEPLHRAALSGYASHYPPDDAYVLDAVFSLGCCLESLGRPQEAQELYQRAATGRRRTLGAADAATYQAESALATCQAVLSRQHSLSPGQNVSLPPTPSRRSLALASAAPEQPPPAQQHGSWGYRPPAPAAPGASQPAWPLAAGGWPHSPGAAAPAPPVPLSPESPQLSAGGKPADGGQSVTALKEAYAQKHVQLQDQITQLQAALHELRHKPSGGGHTPGSGEVDLLAGGQLEQRVETRPTIDVSTTPKGQSPALVSPALSTGREPQQHPSLSFFRVGYMKAKMQLDQNEGSTPRQVPSRTPPNREDSGNASPRVAPVNPAPALRDPGSYCAAVAGFEVAAH